MRRFTWLLVIGGAVLALAIISIPKFIQRTSPVRAPFPMVGPPPAPKTVSPGVAALDAVDRILKGLEFGNIAFNAPSTLLLRESATIQLFLSIQKSIEELQTMITNVGEIEGARIRISDQMEARLSGLGFKIEAVTPEIQAVSHTLDTEWKWEIEPTEPGRKSLHLTLSALLRIEGERTPRVIRTFERVINVRVTLSQRVWTFVSNNWHFLLVTFLFPFGWWLWGKMKRRKKQDRSEEEKPHDNT